MSIGYQICEQDELLCNSPNSTMFKSFTAKKILEAVNAESESRREWMLNLFEFSEKQHKRNEKYQVWTHENHAE